MGLLFEDEPTRRTLGIRERQILYDRAKHKCENCGRDIEFSDMQVGHKTAYSRGGGTSLKNSVCLCYGCNKKQGTDSWDIFQTKQGKTAVIDGIRKALSDLSVAKLRYLAQKRGLKLKARFYEGGILKDDYYQARSKARYVKELSKVISSESEIRSELSGMPAPAKKKRRKTSDSWF